jgi:hypothetical protein
MQSLRCQLHNGRPLNNSRNHRVIRTGGADILRAKVRVTFWGALAMALTIFEPQVRRRLWHLAEIDQPLLPSLFL